MNCLKCEILRAKVKAKALRLFGYDNIEIADTLSRQYGASYRASLTGVYRLSKQPPYGSVGIL